MKFTFLISTLVGCILAGFRSKLLCNTITPSGIYEDWRGGLTMFVQDTSLLTRGNLLVKRDSAAPDRNVLGITAPEDKPVGFAGDSVAEQGDSVEVHLLGLASRSVVGVSAGAITAGNTLISNGDGRVKAGTPAAGEWVVGEAMSDTDSADQPVQVLRLYPVQA